MPPSDKELDAYSSGENGLRDAPWDGPQQAAPNGTPEPEPEPEESGSRRLARRIVLGVAGFIGLIIVGILIFILTLFGDLPPVEKLENPDLDLATVVYTADGELLTRYARQDRTPVPLDSISANVINALVATEDYRFYNHWGFDSRRTASSVVKTLLGDRQGGSTITQQLARNLYKEVGTESTVTRKLRELLTAIQIERNYTKREILEMYLNTVPWGYNTFGIATAGETYFNTPADQLQLKQAAMLIGILKGTSFYNPRRHPERAKSRRNTVLNQMVRYGDLDPALADSLKQTELDLEFTPVTHTTNFAPYFAEHIRLFTQKWAQENGYDLYTDGLVVFTTIDSKLQQAAQRSVDENMPGLQAVVDVNWSEAFGTARARGYQSLDTYRQIEQEGGYEPFETYWARNSAALSSMITETEPFRRLRANGQSRSDAINTLKGDQAFIDSLKAEKQRLEVGFMAMDPNTRHVKAWIGGRNYEIDKYDHVSIARRQPGSTFKPFLYTAAIDNGYSPYYTLLDDSVSLMSPGMPEPWQPRNSGSGFSGRAMTLRQGLATSTNTIAARLVGEIGGEQVQRYAELMGVDSPLEPVYALALGVSDVTLYELSNAYATLASGGLYADPIVVSRIEDQSGNVLAEFTSEAREVLSEETSYTMIDMLRGSIDSGTGRRIRSVYGVTQDVAGKTGTTQGGADGWFMMMHPQLVTGAWVGFNDRRVTFRTNWWGQGAHTALFVVGDFFRYATQSDAVPYANARFTEPAGYTVPLPLTPPDPEDELLNKEGAEEKGRIGW
ncbi:MAG: transglycosylase domain-containing protein [Bacteroidota bacterium]